MDTQLSLHPLRRTRYDAWCRLLQSAGLTPDDAVTHTVFVWDGQTMAATGSRQGNILKCIAVDPAYQGEGLLATVLTALRQNAFEEGHDRLFLYTKPQNEHLFTPLFFYPVAKTDQVLLMENQKQGIDNFLNSLQDAKAESAGAVVVNCDPFTLGHRYLIETAAASCERLYVFVLSEDQSFFAPEGRIQMVRLGTADLSNVTVLPTGPYLISSATFPTYFLKERDKADRVQCALDIEIFAKYFAPKFRIGCRFVGSEPLSHLTNRYNQTLAESLPKYGIDLKVIERVRQSDTPISASAVRAAWQAGDLQTVKKLVPGTTYDYLLQHYQEA